MKLSVTNQFSTVAHGFSMKSKKKKVMPKKVLDSEVKSVNLLDLPIEKLWLSNELGVSRTHLYRLNKSGMTSKQALFLERKLLELARELMDFKVPDELIKKKGD